MNTPDDAHELKQLLEEKEMLRAIQRGPEARAEWLRKQRAEVAALLTEIDHELESLHNKQI